jgi:hypothetical protein
MAYYFTLPPIITYGQLLRFTPDNNLWPITSITTIVSQQMPIQN